MKLFITSTLHQNNIKRQIMNLSIKDKSTILTGEPMNIVGNDHTIGATPNIPTFMLMRD